jgi:hypothetical protein
MKAYEGVDVLNTTLNDTNVTWVQWHEVHTKFHKIPLTISKFITGQTLRCVMPSAPTFLQNMEKRETNNSKVLDFVF